MLGMIGGKGFFICIKIIWLKMRNCVKNAKNFDFFSESRKNLMDL